jgi:Zn-finger nucleic acid-binding protein
MTERQGVEIDYCPQCRGVWLDRGELDKIIERQAAFVQPAPPPPPPANDPNRRYDDDDDDDDRYQRGGQGQYPRRKKSWLSELFD